MQEQSMASLTDRVRINEALQEREKLLTSIYDTVGDCIFLLSVVDGRYRFESVNHAFVRVTGLNKEAVEGKYVDEVIPEPSLSSIVLKNYARAITERKIIQWEEVSNYSTGILVGIVSVAPVFDKNGVCTHLVGSVHDITERKRIEDDLRASEERYRLLVESSPEGIMVHKNGLFVFANQAALTLFGATDPKQLIGQPIIERVHPDFRSVVQKRVAALDGGPHTSLLEEKLLRLDGSVIDVEVTASKITFQGSDAVQVVGRDVTETKRLRLLESRTQRLETAAQIAGQVAHDFNNLLGPIIAYPEFIRDELPPDHPARKYLNAIETAATKIADINQQLLTLSRRAHYDQEALDLNALILASLGDLGQLPATLICETDLLDDLMHIKGGAAQLHRVFINLLINARDALQDIGTISIKTENCYVDDTKVRFGRVPKGEYVKVTVTDTGCGIPNEIIQKIFDPFFTTKLANQRRGSGLGLSVVNAVVKDHGGYIDLSTEVGVGTSFHLYFPTTHDSPNETPGEEIPGGGETLLVVDDDQIQRDVSSELLTKLGYNVTTCESGEKAIKLLKDKSQNLLILDMIMPDGIDGVETYRRALLINPNQKAIIVSGFSETERVREVQNMGAGAFVKKPLNRKTIALAVRNELDRVAETASLPSR